MKESELKDTASIGRSGSAAGVVKSLRVRMEEEVVEGFLAGC